MYIFKVGSTISDGTALSTICSPITANTDRMLREARDCNWK